MTLSFEPGSNPLAADQHLHVAEAWRTSADFFQVHAELAGAASRFPDPTEEQLVEIRARVGAWLASGGPADHPTTLPIPISPGPSGASSSEIGGAVEVVNPAYARLRALADFVRKEFLSAPIPGLLFKADATEALVSAMESRDRELGLGVVADGDPDVGPDLVSAAPIVDWLPTDRKIRSEFTKGLPSYAHPIPDRAHHIVSLLSNPTHLSRQIAALTGSPTVAEVVQHYADQGAGPDVELEAAPRRFVKVGDKNLEVLSYYDGTPGYDEATSQIAKLRQRYYREAGLLDAGAKDEDDIRGENVEVVALRDPDTNEILASFRWIHADGERLAELPSYQKFSKAHAFDPEKLAELHAAAAGRHVVELGGLWVNPSAGHETTLALLREGIQRSVAENTIWFMGVVTYLHRQLLGTYGQRVVHTIGRPIRVEGENATDKAIIHPDWVDAAAYYESMMLEMQDAEKEGDFQRMFSRGQMLGHYLIGLDWGKLDPPTRRKLEILTGVVYDAE